MDLFKKIAFFVIVFSFFISIVHAANFEVEVVPVNDRIVIDETATFQLNIKNNLANTDEYRIYTLDFPTWDVRTEPLVNPITLIVRSRSEGSIEIIVDPLKIRDIGTYAVNVNVRSKVTDDFVSVPLKVTILSTEPLIGGYVPTIVTGVDIPEKIDPREEIPIKISLNNQNILDYPDLTIKLESNLINDEIHTKLGPKEEKTLDLTANLDPLTEPQEDRLVVAIFKDDRSIINPIARQIEVIEYYEQELVSQEKKFLRTISHYNFVSNNKGYEGKFKVETTMLGSIFSSTNPKTDIVKENGKRYFVADIALENNIMQVTVTKNFIPLFVAIVLLIVLAISYYMLRSPLHITKEASSISRSEGGISEMTVILRLRNRGQNKIMEIEVTEFIPALVSVEKEVPIGSLEPAKVLRHEKKESTVIKWAVDHLDVSEERVLSYKIKSKLSILGSFSLPATKARFKYDDKVLTSMSNRLSVSD